MRWLLGWILALSLPSLPASMPQQQRTVSVLIPARNEAATRPNLVAALSTQVLRPADVIVLDDDVNTFQHVVDCLVRHLPAMQPDQAWTLAHRIDSEGAATVWRGPQEQAELYHQLLGAEGLTMAPLEPD